MEAFTIISNIDKIVKKHPENYRYILATALSYLMQFKPGDEADGLIKAKAAIEKLIKIIPDSL
jgi:hypothetical protein